MVVDVALPQPTTAGRDPAMVRDTGIGSPLDAPVPADLAPPLQPAILPVPRPWLHRQHPRLAPVEVDPPRAEISGPYEIDALAQWDVQVEEAEASGESLQGHAVVPDWANLETPPVPDMPSCFASPAPAFPEDVDATVEEPPPLLEPRDVLNAIRPFWYEGVPAHHLVAADILSRFSTTLTPPQLRGILGWMFHQRRDMAWYFQWWLDQRQALGEAPADTLSALRQLLYQMEHAPDPKRDRR